jgi:hypothetical protein
MTARCPLYPAGADSGRGRSTPQRPDIRGRSGDTAEYSRLIPRQRPCTTQSAWQPLAGRGHHRRDDEARQADGAPCGNLHPVADRSRWPKRGRPMITDRKEGSPQKRKSSAGIPHTVPDAEPASDCRSNDPRRRPGSVELCSIHAGGLVESRIGSGCQSARSNPLQIISLRGCFGLDILTVRTTCYRLLPDRLPCHRGGRGR